MYRVDFPWLAPWASETPPFGLSPNELSNGLLLRKSPWDPALRGCEKIEFGRRRSQTGALSRDPQRSRGARDKAEDKREESRITLISQGLRPGLPKCRPSG